MENGDAGDRSRALQLRFRFRSCRIIFNRQFRFRHIFNQLPGIKKKRRAFINNPDMKIGKKGRDGATREIVLSKM